jgi:hypothetical protein
VQTKSTPEMIVASVLVVWGGYRCWADRGIPASLIGAIRCSMRRRGAAVLATKAPFGQAGLQRPFPSPLGRGMGSPPGHLDDLARLRPIRCAADGCSS